LLQFAETRVDELLLLLWLLQRQQIANKYKSSNCIRSLPLGCFIMMSVLASVGNFGKAQQSAKHCPERPTQLNSTEQSELNSTR